MNGYGSHRLDGLEPDNLLAFLALLGLLRALEAYDREAGSELRPRVAWDVKRLPVRPRVYTASCITQEAMADAAAVGLDMLAKDHAFDGRLDLNYSRDEARCLLQEETRRGRLRTRQRLDLLASLMSDFAIREDRNGAVDPTPLCLLQGQGHQHFLDRLAHVPRQPAPPAAGRSQAGISAAACIGDALFSPWHRRDATFSFRWDPDEDVRYALMAGDPTDSAYKGGTQHGANRLGAVGLAALTVVPRTRAGRLRPTIIGGDGPPGFTFAWPVWREPATLAAIRALLAHPRLRIPGALAHLSVEHVLLTRRISVGKFTNFSRARPIVPG